jgi:hypothetical protein
VQIEGSPKYLSQFQLMFRYLIILFTAISLSNFNAIGQNIQWASAVETQSNNYDTDKWSANVVLGAPDAMPYGELNPNAFRLKNEKTNGGFTVSFANPQSIRQVIIFESFNPGRIERVFIYDENKIDTQFLKKAMLIMTFWNINNPSIWDRCENCESRGEIEWSSKKWLGSD